MDGYQVMTMDEAAPLGNVFLTATGMKDVVIGRHMKKMKSGAIMANLGHYNVEVNEPDLMALSKSKKRVRNALDEYETKDGRFLYLIGEGRLANLAAAEGHPSVRTAFVAS